MKFNKGDIIVDVWKNNKYKILSIIERSYLLECISGRLIQHYRKNKFLKQSSEIDTERFTTEILYKKSLYLGS